MDSFFIEYNDPLFSIIIFLSIIFIIMVATTIWNNYFSMQKERSLKRFSKRFEHIGLDDESMHSLEIEKKPTKELLFLARLYQNSGDYQRAIRIYLTMIEKLDCQKEKIVVLESLGISFFRAGFLHRARDTFLEVIKNYPRSSSVLRELLLVYDSLGEYKRALELLTPLEELGERVEDERSYFEILDIINSKIATNNLKIEQILQIYKKNNKVIRVVLEYLQKSEDERFFDLLKECDCLNYFDILWRVGKEHIDKKEKNRLLRDIFIAKGYIDGVLKECEVFELNALYAINRCGMSDATLSFEYLCLECKSIFPFSFSRCPNCYKLFEIEPFAILQKDRAIKQYHNS